MVPKILEHSVYIQRDLTDHLLISDTYHQFTNNDAYKYANKISNLIEYWLTKTTVLYSLASVSTSVPK